MIASSLSHHILTLTINRPHAKNALNLEMYQQLTQYLHQASVPNVHVIVLTGLSDVFCSGNDITDFISLTIADADQCQHSRSIIEAFMFAMIDCPVPIVAAVSGNAIGIGMTMLQHCDFVLACPSANFSLPFVKLGLCPEFGSSLLLPQIIGTRKAKAMLLLGEPMNAKEALSLGFIDQITIQPEQLAATYAATLATQPKHALQNTKQLLSQISRKQLIDCINKENNLIFKLVKEHEAVNAFSQFTTRKSHT